MGVTKRFIEAIEELKKKALIARGVPIRTNKKEILTKKEIDLKTLEKKEVLLERKKAEAAPKLQLDAPKAPVKKTVAKAPVAKKTTEPKLATVKVIKKPAKATTKKK